MEIARAVKGSYGHREVNRDATSGQGNETKLAQRAYGVQYPGGYTAVKEVVRDRANAAISQRLRKVTAPVVESDGLSIA